MKWKFIIIAVLLGIDQIFIRFKIGGISYDRLLEFVFFFVLFKDFVAELKVNSFFRKWCRIVVCLAAIQLLFKLYLAIIGELEFQFVYTPLIKSFSFIDLGSDSGNNLLCTSPLHHAQLSKFPDWNFPLGSETISSQICIKFGRWFFMRRVLYWSAFNQREKCIFLHFKISISFFTLVSLLVSFIEKQRAKYIFRIPDPASFDAVVFAVVKHNNFSLTPRFSHQYWIAQSYEPPYRAHDPIVPKGIFYILFFLLLFEISFLLDPILQ